MYGYVTTPCMAALFGGRRAQNLLSNSYQFDSAAWGGTNAEILVVPAIPDCFGGSHGSIMIAADATPPAMEAKAHAGIVLQARTYCMSVWIKAQLVSDGTFFGVVNDGTDTIYRQKITWSGTAAVVGSAENIDSAAAVAVSTWWRCNAVFTVPAGEGGDIFIPQIFPWGADTAQYHGIQICGVQLTAGSAAAPYQERD